MTVAETFAELNVLSGASLVDLLPACPRGAIHGLERSLSDRAATCVCAVLSHSQSFNFTLDTLFTRVAFAAGIFIEPDQFSVVRTRLSPFEPNRFVQHWCIEFAVYSQCISKV